MAKDASPLLLGAHVSVAGGLPTGIERATDIGATAAQVFVKNSNQWKGRTLGETEVEEFRASWSCSDIREISAHACYLINLASPDSQLWERSIGAMADELVRCRRLGLANLVFHPGAHRGEGESWAVRRVAEALDLIVEQGVHGEVRLALETTAGQGTQIGYRFEHIRDILGACRYPSELRVCLDTCHVFAAGYDFRTRRGYRQMMRSFEGTVGIDRLALVHTNDSRRECGSRRDRHQHLGKGEIGRSGFFHLMNDPRLKSKAKILETPKGKDLEEDRVNLAFLRDLVIRAPAAGAGDSGSFL